MLRSLEILAVLIAAVPPAYSWSTISPQQKVDQLLQEADKAQPEAWAELLLKADAEATKMQRDVPSECCGFRCVTIRQYRLTFKWNQIGGMEDYQHDLLRTVANARRGTSLGAKALAGWLQSGCQASLANEWAPYYKTVLDILDAPPWRTLNDLALTRVRAQAYETWWSLSKAPPSSPELVDSELKPEDFQIGAAQAQSQAIAAYSTVIARDPADREALQHLRSLKANQDTGQRRWYCFGD